MIVGFNNRSKQVHSFYSTQFRTRYIVYGEDFCQYNFGIIYNENTFVTLPCDHSRYICLSIFALKHQRKRFLVFNCSYYGSFIKKISEMDHLKQAVISRN